MKRHLTVVLPLLAASLGTGCDHQPEDAYVNRDLGIRFEFPDQWTRLTAAEMEPGKKALVTIGDPLRSAVMSLSEFDLKPLLASPEASLAMALASHENISKAGAVLTLINTTFEKSFSKRYPDYELLDQTLARSFADTAATDLTFVGTRAGEDKMWRKVVVLLPQRAKGRGLIVAFRATWDEREKLEKDLEAIESRWLNY